MSSNINGGVSLLETVENQLSQQLYNIAHVSNDHGAVMEFAPERVRLIFPVRRTEENTQAKNECKQPSTTQQNLSLKNRQVYKIGEGGTVKVIHNGREVTVREGISKGVFTYHCVECDYVCSQESKLWQHEQIHKPYPCPDCGETVKGKKALNTHRKKAHSKTYPCEQCSRVLKSVSALQKHEQIHSREFVHKCDLCGKTYRDLISFKRHMLAHTGVKQHSCEICSNTFYLPEDLKKHIKIHYRDPLSVKQHMCNQCGKTFTRLEHLKGHLATHSGVRTKIKCTKCDRTFTQKVNYQRHLRTIHEDVRPHKCSLCQKVFARGYQLRKHMKAGKHAAESRRKRKTGEKEECFICDKCGKSFKTSQLLKIHMEIHLNLRRFKCKLCDKDFNSTTACKRHMESHLDFRRYQCGECSKRFLRKAHLVTHMLTHTGVKPHACTHCERAFTDSRNLKSHIRKVHGGHM